MKTSKVSRDGRTEGRGGKEAKDVGRGRVYTVWVADEGGDEVAGVMELRARSSTHHKTILQQAGKMTRRLQSLKPRVEPGRRGGGEGERGVCVWSLNQHECTQR